MLQYQLLTAEVVPAARKRGGGKGGKRGPRSLAAVVMTAATRLLNEEHKAGKPKKNAANAALDRASSLAAGRKEQLTDELKAQISAKADSIWGGKK
jgi:hypothetical protein